MEEYIIDQLPRNPDGESNWQSEFATLRDSIPHRNEPHSKTDGDEGNGIGQFQVNQHFYQGYRVFTAKWRDCVTVVTDLCMA
jgi:hypothetical protein